LVRTTLLPAVAVAVVQGQVAPLREQVAALQAAAEQNRVLHEGMLFAAAKSGDTAGVLMLLQHTSLPVDYAPADGVTLMLTASHDGHLDLVKALLRRGAEVDRASTRGWTPLLAASSAGHLGVVEALLGKEAEVKTKRSMTEQQRYTLRRCLAT
jgi:ankyrin repeat protein